MSFESLRSFLTTKGLEVPKYAQARYKGTAIFKVGLFYKFYKNYNEGDWKEIKPIEIQIDLNIF
jgi:hypothetical protein